MKKLTTLAFALLFSAGANAAAGDHTLTFGYAQKSSSAIKAVSDNAKDVFESGYYDESLKYNRGSFSPLRGVAIKHRYEFTDSWGMITAFEYTHQNSFINGSNDAGENERRAHVRFSSDIITLTTGATYRFNDYVSAYGTAGFAFTSLHANTYREIKENKDIIYSAGEDSYAKGYSPAYSLGAQFNVSESFVFDLAYSGTTGKYKSSGFNAGIGYKF